MAIGANCSARWTGIDKVSKADIRRVANQVFVANNRTVGDYRDGFAAANKGGQQ